LTIGRLRAEDTSCHVDASATAAAIKNRPLSEEQRAQNAALSIITAGLPSIKPRSLAIAQTKTGGIFLFGDAINVFLFS
jgi:hypothetical protein